MINCSKGVIVSINGSNVTVREDKKHYDFTGQELCEVNVKWQINRKDAQGKEEEVDCSITFLVNEDGIKKVVGEPRFGEITDRQEALELIKQNEEVFINGESLYDAITKKEENEQDVEESELLQRKTMEDLINDSLSIDEENVSLRTNSRNDSIFSIDSSIADLDSTSTQLYSSRSPSFSSFSVFDYSSSKGDSDIEFEGYGTRPKSSSFSVPLRQRLLSRRNSLETSAVENKTEQLIKSVTELELEVDRLKQKNEWLAKNKKVVEEEKDEYMLGLEEAEEKVAKLKLELNGKDKSSKKRINELFAKQDQVFEENDREVKEIKQEIEGLEDSIKRILNLTAKLGEQEDKIQQLQAGLDEVLEDRKEKTIVADEYGEALRDGEFDYERDLRCALKSQVMLLVSGCLKDQENGLETQKKIKETLDVLSSNDIYNEVKVLNLEEALQAEQKKSSNLEKDLQAEKTKALNLEKGFQDEKTKVFNLEKKLQDEHVKLSGLGKDLKYKKQEVADLKKRNSTNISKAKRASSIAALLTGLVLLFSLIQSTEFCCALLVVFLISLACCIYNIWVTHEEHGYHSHDLSVSRADSVVLEDFNCIQQNQIETIVS